MFHLARKEEKGVLPRVFMASVAVRRQFWLLLSKDPCEHAHETYRRSRSLTPSLLRCRVTETCVKNSEDPPPPPPNV